MAQRHVEPSGLLRTGFYTGRIGFSPYLRGAGPLKLSLRETFALMGKAFAEAMVDLQ